MDRRAATAFGGGNGVLAGGGGSSGAIVDGPGADRRCGGLRAKRRQRGSGHAVARIVFMGGLWSKVWVWLIWGLEVRCVRAPGGIDWRAVPRESADGMRGELNKRGL